MARTRNPRRVVLEVIRAIKSNASTMAATWDHVPSLSWRQDEDGRFIHAPRERKDVPASEYRENSPEQWARLAEFMDVIVAQAQNVATFARRQEREARLRALAEVATPPAGGIVGTRGRALGADDPHSAAFRG